MLRWSCLEYHDDDDDDDDDGGGGGDVDDGDGGGGDDAADRQRTLADIVADQSQHTVPLIGLMMVDANVSHSGLCNCILCVWSICWNGFSKLEL